MWIELYQDFHLSERLQHVRLVLKMLRWSQFTRRGELKGRIDVGDEVS